MISGNDHLVIFQISHVFCFHELVRYCWDSYIYWRGAQKKKKKKKKGHSPLGIKTKVVFVPC
jgi:hypothetical protein